MLRCMHVSGLYRMQGEAIYRAPWLYPRLRIYTSCSYRQSKSGYQSPIEGKSLYIPNTGGVDIYVYGRSRSEKLLWM